MFKDVLAVVAAFVTLVIPVSLRAKEPHLLPASVVSTAQRWVEHKMGVSHSYPPPAVVISQQALEHGGHFHKDLARHDETIVGLYVPGAVVLSPDVWNPYSKPAVSYLIHEIVHHIQFMSGRRFACEDEREIEAYRLQNAWLAELGHPPLHDEGWVKARFSC